MKKNLDIVRDYLNGERPFVQVGYTGVDKYIIRQEGEKWTDHLGKEWIQTKSGPQSVNRIMDIVREAMNVKCSGCGCEIRWRGRTDEKLHAKTGMCLDCLSTYETKLRAQGKYKAYEKQKMLRNELSHLKDVKKHLEDSKTYLEEHKVFTFVNSNGLVEEWDNEAADDVRKSLKKDYTRCLKEIKRVEAELKLADAEFNGTSTTG
jgi:hypothetical protein